MRRLFFGLFWLRIVATRQPCQPKSRSLHSFFNNLYLHLQTTMKLLLATTALFVTASGAWEVRKLNQPDRKLGQFDFLISDASPEDGPLCITATDGMRNFGNLKLMPCDFNQFPPEQLWNYEDDQFFNDLGNSNSKCMVANHGDSLFDGVRMRLADCDASLSNNEFIYDGEYIKFASNTSYCLTNRGPIAHAGDPIHAKPCLDRDDFKWSHTDEDPRQDGGTLYTFYADGGWISPKNCSTAKSTKIILGDCPWGGWNVKQVDGVKIFRSGSDISMCLQAGLGGSVMHGTVLRLMPCDANEKLQQFDWNDETPIKLAADHDDLCLEWRGRNVNVGVDPIIMKSCDRTVYEGWSGDEVYY